jgi:hypothetical protein
MNALVSGEVWTCPWNSEIKGGPCSRIYYGRDQENLRPNSAPAPVRVTKVENIFCSNWTAGIPPNNTACKDWPAIAACLHRSGLTSIRTDNTVFFFWNDNIILFPLLLLHATHFATASGCACVRRFRQVSIPSCRALMLLLHTKKNPMGQMTLLLHWN